MLITALLLLAASLSTQELYPIAYVAPSPGGGFGDFPVWIIDTSYRERSELYLGERFYLVFDLREFSGKLYVEIKEGGRLIVAGTTEGGYVYGYPMTIVEPIYEGRQYTYTVSVWDARTLKSLGSASAGYVEKYCPDMQIADVSWDSFVYGESSAVRVSVHNLGESGWTHTVEAWTEGVPRSGGPPP